MRGAPQHLVDDRAVDLFGQLLGQVADARATADVDLARVGGLLTDDDLEQRRLADTVATDEREHGGRVRA